MLVHHTGHDESRMRGSSALRAGVDTEISLRADKERKRLVHLRTPKQRDMDKSISMTVKLMVRPLGTDTDGDPITTVMARFEASKDGASSQNGARGKGLSQDEQWDDLARETLCSFPAEGATAPAVARAVPSDHPLRDGRTQETVDRRVREALKRLAERGSSGVFIDRNRYCSMTIPAGK